MFMRAYDPYEYQDNEHYKGAVLDFIKCDLSNYNYSGIQSFLNKVIENDENMAQNAKELLKDIETYDTYNKEMDASYIQYYSKGMGM